MWVKDKNSTETSKKICTIYDEDVITDYQVRKWFSKFHSGNTELEDEPKPRLSSDVDEDAVRE